MKVDSKIIFTLLNNTINKKLKENGYSNLDIDKKEFWGSDSVNYYSWYYKVKLKNGAEYTSKFSSYLSDVDCPEFVLYEMQKELC